MKTMKLTTAVLALIAAALFTSSAQAATTGDLILGVYDTSNGVANSYEVDLGAFNTLSQGETFVLGTSLANVFSSDSSATLAFDISASGNTLGVAGVIGAKEIAVSAPALFTITAGNHDTTPAQNINGQYSAFGGGTALSLPNADSSNGTPYSAISLANSTSGSFAEELAANGGSFGIAGTPTLLTAYTVGSTTSTDFFTIAASTTQGVASPDGTFELTGSGAGTELIFDPVAAPEPSTYALLAGGLLALWMIKRRRSNA